MMKYLSLLSCLLAPCSLAEDEAAVVIVPWSVSFNYIDLGDESSNEIIKGTKVVFKIEATEGNGVEESTRMWFYRSSPEEKRLNLYSKDSKGNDLGELKHAGYDFNYFNYRDNTDEEGLFYYLTFSRLPSIGSEGLNLTGEVPVCLFSSKTTSPAQPLHIKKGAQLFLGDLTLTVDIPKKEQRDGKFKAEFGFSSPNRAMKIIGMEFFNPDGRPLVDDKGKPGYSSRGGGRSINSASTSENLDYSFKQPPDLLQVSVTYWAKIEEPEVPVPREILFYDRTVEEADQKEK